MNDKMEVVDKRFEAILNFVQELKEVFTPKGKNPLNLYNRLLNRIKITDTENVNRIISGFAEFTTQNKEALLNSTEINKNVIIKFGESKRVYLEIGKYLLKKDV